MNLLCIDVGNTFTKIALVNDKIHSHTTKVPTVNALEFTQPLLDLQKTDFEGISFCSVVPHINESFLRKLNEIFPKKNIFHLTHLTAKGLDIRYPNPAGIGQDRLAVVIGAQSLLKKDAIIIDMGTAVTFDIISKKFGYETSIIAPGLELMTSYLHEKTAQLPLLDPYKLDYTSTIGQLTEDAMKAGCAIGFTGMVAAILKAVQKELQTRSNDPYEVVLTGGSAANLLKSELKGAIFEPNLSSIGLYEAYLRFNHPSHP